MEHLLRKYSQVFFSTGLGDDAPSVYASRRKELLESLSSLCVFAGVDRAPGSEEVWTQIGNRQVQEPALLFLTGVNQPGALLVLDPLADSPAEREVLFLPAKDPKREFWDGVQLGLPAQDSGDADEDRQEILRLTGISQVRLRTAFNAWMTARLSVLPRDHIFGYWLEFETPEGVRKVESDHNWEFRKSLKRLLARQGKAYELRNVASLHLHQRAILDKYRTRMARSAQAYTRHAFMDLLPRIPGHASERTLAAELEYRLLQNTDEGLAFPTIVAAGQGACTLHYQKKDEPLKHGQLVLLDFGCRVGSLCSDISRTVPVSGTFNPLQKLLYQMVLDTQRYHQKSVRPGETIRELSKKTWTYLETLLRDRFFALGGEAQRSYAFNPHGVSHLIGEQVHEGDPFRVYQDLPLRPGMMLSNEPGLYGHFTLRMDGKLYREWIGIRIEDDLLVTAKGCVNLSAAIPKTVEEIESLMTG